MTKILCCCITLLLVATGITHAQSAAGYIYGMRWLNYTNGSYNDISLLRMSCATGGYDSITNILTSGTSASGSPGNSGLAVDPYNQRIFWASTSYQTYPNAIFINSISLPTLARTQSDTFISPIAGLEQINELKYDPYGNRVLFHNVSHSKLMAADMATGHITTICALPATSGSTSDGGTLAYDPYTGRLLTLNLSGSNASITLINTLSGAVIASQNAVYPGQPIPIFIYCNLADGDFYGAMANQNIVRIDSTSLATTAISVAADSPRTKVNLEFTFDTDHQRFLQMYCDGIDCSQISQHQYLAGIDASTGHILYDRAGVGMTSLVYMDSVTYSARLLYNPETGFKAPYTTGAYAWYRNDTLLPGAAGQEYQPTISGYYKAALITADSRQIVTAPRWYGTGGLSVAGIGGAKALQVRPQPMLTYAEFVIPATASGAVYEGRIINSLGMCVWARSGIAAGVLRVERDHLPAGLYLYRFTGNEDEQFAGKLLVE